MDIQSNLSDLLSELDACRVSRGMSRKSVADACGVSEATISRVFSGTVEPSYQIVQDIAAAVQYTPPQADIIPSEFTQDGYICFLQETIHRQREENDRRVRQLQAHYNMLRSQDRRTILVMGSILGILVVFICALFLYDFAHLDRGWIQAYSSDITGSNIGQAVLSFFERLQEV